MKRAVCFYDIFNNTKPYMVIEKHLRVIPLKKIIGTVDKCGELDTKFRYIKRRDRKERFRRAEIHRKTRESAFFPPISVNLYQGDFYVIDGHRRVSAAIENRLEFIDAYVYEYIPESDQAALDGTLAQKRFEVESRVTTIQLSDSRGFTSLLRDLEQFCGDTITREKALKWKSERFLPACRSISNSSLAKHYNSLLPGDIYALIFRFYDEYMNGFPHYNDFDSIISGYLFARGFGRRRIYRRFPFRCIFSLITRKTG